MRSRDLARFAGVTVRTVRHYHQIGLLAEPGRDANGYRRYRVEHLVRLLRIGRLTALGLPLRDIPALLDGAGEPRVELLDGLDAALERQIEGLQDQRRIIAALRDSTLPLDTPHDLASALAPLEVGRSANAIRSGREQLVLLASMIAAEGRAAIAELYERLADPALAVTVQELGRRFDDLSPDTTSAEIADLAAAYLTQLGPWLRAYETVMADFTGGDARTLLAAHALEAMTPQQKDFLAVVAAKIAQERD
jgi:DNA-binding transcriptional MerR regulator